MNETTTELQAELEAIIAWFESDDADIDAMADKYQRGQAITAELQKRLQKTKNKITKLKQSFTDA